LSRKAAIGLFMLITLGPLVLGLGYSLLYSLGLIGLMNDGFTLTHWNYLFSSTGAWQSLGYTVIVTVVSLLLSIGSALFLSWSLIQRPITFKDGLSLFVPMLFPPLIAGFVWYQLLNPAGFLSRLVLAFGLIDQLASFPRWVNDSWNVGIIVTHVYLIFPIFSILFLAQSRKLRMPEMKTLAVNLGSTSGQFFRKVYAPILLQTTKPIIWLYGIFLMGMYEVPLLLGRSAPQAVSVFITEKMTRFNLYDIPVGHAMSVLYTVTILLIVSLFVRKKAFSVL
jgi:putative spermidine/putrescine transport system permease protein